MSNQWREGVCTGLLVTKAMDLQTNSHIWNRQFFLSHWWAPSSTASLILHSTTRNYHLPFKYLWLSSHRMYRKWSPLQNLSDKIRLNYSVIIHKQLAKCVCVGGYNHTVKTFKIWIFKITKQFTDVRLS